MNDHRISNFKNLNIITQPRLRRIRRRPCLQTPFSFFNLKFNPPRRPPLLVARLNATPTRHRFTAQPEPFFRTGPHAFQQTNFFP